MGWKSTIKSIQATNRRIDKLNKQREKERIAEAAQAAVKLYNDYVESLVSVHKKCAERKHWNIVHTWTPPRPPIKSTVHGDRAREALASYKPRFLSKLFGKVHMEQQDLNASIMEADHQDDRLNRDAMAEHHAKLAVQEATVSLAKRVVEGDLKAYREAWSTSACLNALKVIGTCASIDSPSATFCHIKVDVNTADVIPDEQYTYLKSGKLSEKPMPKKAYNELYQDHVCSAAIRLAREAFALLPYELVLVTAVGSLLNETSGHFEQRPILSVMFPREPFQSITFGRIDCSKCVEGYTCRMDFKAVSGFAPINPLDPNDFLS